MSFKVKNFNIIQTLPTVYDWLLDHFSRMGTSDISPYFLKDIGVWNMDATDSISVDLGGIKASSLIHVGLSIYKDDQNLFPAELVKDGIESIEVDRVTNTVIITRFSGGPFDSPDYDESTMNRGILKIWT